MEPLEAFDPSWPKSKKYEYLMSLKHDALNFIMRDLGLTWTPDDTMGNKINDIVVHTTEPGAVDGS